jgi:hypothetical protein
MKMKPKGRLVALAMMAATLAACEQSTAPDNPATFDAEAVLGDYQALDSIFSSPAMLGFEAMASGITFQSLGSEAELMRASAERLGTLGALQAEVSDGGGTALRWAGGLGRFVQALGPEVARSPLISQLRRGKTFIYDPSLERYVIDPDREGAPDTGVRFILYAPSQGHPDVTREIGYADLVDEGDGSAEDVALRLLVVDGSQTVLDYRTTVDVMAHGGKVTVAGFLQGPYDRLDFDLGVEGTDGSGGSDVNISFDMGLENRGFRAVGTVHGMNGSTGEGGEIHLVASHGHDSFAVDLTGTDTTIDGSVKLNGSLFATISGDPDQPTVTSADGDPLNALEALALLHVAGVSGSVFVLFGHLMDPIDELVLLALIL